MIPNVKDLRNTANYKFVDLWVGETFYLTTFNGLEDKDKGLCIKISENSFFNFNRSKINEAFPTDEVVKVIAEINVIKNE